MAYWLRLSDTASHTFTLGVLQIKLTLLHLSSSCLQETAGEQKQEVSSKQQTKWWSEQQAADNNQASTSSTACVH
jgi:hypothetical protein